MPNRQDPPTVGLTLSSRATEEQARPYRAALEVHGARVVELRPSDGAVEAALHGLLLSGGGDIEPTRLGQERHPNTGNIDVARDEMELRLTREALASGVPVLGICRGVQVLGVALGGTLIQDVPDRVANAVGHSDARHMMMIACGSRLSGILGCGRLEVNSYPHQANDALGEGVRAAARSDDNMIEAIELDGRRFVVGVQWHPERMDDDATQTKLFAAFVAAAGERSRAETRERKT